MAKKEKTPAKAKPAKKAEAPVQEETPVVKQEPQTEVSPSAEKRPQKGKKPAKQHLSRKEKKALYKEQLALEKSLVAEGRIPPRAKYVPRGIMWRVLSVCLAFFLGILACIGGLVGGALWLGTKKSMKDLFGMINMDYSKYLSESYAELPLIDFAQSVAKLDFSSLKGISDVTPLLRSTLEKTNEQLGALGVRLDIDELIAQPFSSIGTYMQEHVVGEIVLGETLSLNANSDGLILELCYGAKGVDWTEGEDGAIVPVEGGKAPLKIKDLSSGESSLIDRITVEGALNVNATSSSAMRYLAYGTEGIHYVIEGEETERTVRMLENPHTHEVFPKKTLGDLTSSNDDLIKGAKISDLVAIDSSTTGILNAIRDWSISDLENSYRIERLRLSDILDIKEDTSRLMKAIADWRIGDLMSSEKMNTLSLGDVLTIDENSSRILQTLADAQLGELDTRVKTLRLSEILDEKDMDGNKLLKNLKSSTLDTLNDDVKKLSVRDVFGDEMYSFMKKEGDGPKSYLEALNKYDHTSSEADLRKPFAAYQFADGESFTEESYVGETPVTFAYFAYTGDVSAPELDLSKRYDESEVYTELATVQVDGDVPSTETVRHYYVLEEETIVPIVELCHVNYDEKKIDPPLASGLVTAEPGSDYPKLDTDSSHTPYTDGEHQYYYLEEHYKTPEHPEGEKRAIPLYLSSGGDVYFTYLGYERTETPPAEGEEGEPVVTESYPIVREDFEFRVTGYTKNGEPYLTLNEKGDAFILVSDKENPEAKTVTVHKGTVPPVEEEASPTEYEYVKTRVDVVARYYDEAGNRAHTENEVSSKFFLVNAEGEKTDELDRYLSGVWNLMFAEEHVGDGGTIESITDHAITPILEINSTITGMSNKISHTELWKLYFYGILGSDPYVDLTNVLNNNPAWEGGINVGSAEQEKRVKNLNECTVVECITLIQELTKILSGS